MVIHQTKYPGIWIYVHNNKQYSFEIDENLYYFLKKDRFYPEVDVNDIIIKLKNVPIELIIEELINNEYKNYYFTQESLTIFELVIQRLKEKEKKASN